MKELGTAQVNLSGLKLLEKKHFFDCLTVYNSYINTSFEKLEAKRAQLLCLFRR